MRMWSRTILIFIIGLTLLTQFTNCDTYSDNGLFTTMSTTCEGDDCFTQSADSLEIRLNSPSEVFLATNVREFDMGGDCNEGGFSTNRIIWELYRDATLVNSSAGLAQQISCVLGRFQIRVVLPAKGLCFGGSLKDHRLDVEVIGVDEEGQDQKNPMLGRKTIYLKPLTPAACT